MIIESIELKNYRNYKELHMEFNQGTNILYGDNAQGKTNILEAVYVCCTSKSHKSAKDRDIIRFNQDESHIKLQIRKNNVPYRIDMHLKKNKPKGIAINGVPIRKASELFGIANVVFFSPEDLNIIKNGPSERRRFIDMELCQLNKLYVHSLVQYNKVLLQRNKLLKELFFRPEYEETLEAMFHNGSGDGGQLEWIMDHEGITVVFNPYVLGPWSEGSLESRMTFADCPDLLLETYQAGAGAAVQLSEGEPFYADWDRDGEKEEYIYTVQVDEETYTSSITLSRTGEGAETEAAGPWEAGGYGSLTDVWLLEAGDGRPFLWLEFSSENDLRALEVFALQNENGTLTLCHVGSSGDSMYGSFIGDPGHFLLYDRIDLLGTYMAYRSFRMGEDGMPETDGTVYTIPGNGDRGPVLRASAEIPVWIEGKEERIPAGTELVLRAAELPDETGAARAEAELPDGRHCELRIQKDRDQYRFRIGGMDEYDCFESLGYAG